MTERVSHESSVSRLTPEQDVLIEYCQHDSWRCGHPPHYYFAKGKLPEPIANGDDCPCGLVRALRGAGVDPTPWHPLHTRQQGAE